MVGLVKSSHVVGVVSVTKPERSIENILSDYNVPKEVIQLVSERNKELEALDALKKEIQGGNKIELKKQYDGVDNDGDAQPFLKRFYEDDIKSGRLNAANLRVIDKNCMTEYIMKYIHIMRIILTIKKNYQIIFLQKKML